MKIWGLAKENPHTYIKKLKNRFMKQIFIYDQYGLELLSCQFAGMSEEGKPQLVVTTPGKTV